MKNKILSMILAVVMLASACSMMIIPVGADTATFTPLTETSGVYTISSAQDIDTFRQMMINGTTFAGKTVALAKDINMADMGEDYVYTMDNNTSHGFYGTFDGNGKTIFNLVVRGSKNNGFFGCLSGDTTGFDYNNTSVTIKNVAFVNSSSVSKGGDDDNAFRNVGLLYGSVEGATVNIQNVYVDTQMNSDVTVTGNPYSIHGGLIGYSKGMHLNMKDTVVYVVTLREALGRLGYGGALVGLAASTTAGQDKITVTTSALYGRVGFYMTYYPIGFDRADKVLPTFEVDRALIDLDQSADGYDPATGLWTGIGTFAPDDTTEPQTVKGLNATPVNGFTATEGHMMPTNLFNMFPQHCNKEGTKVAFEGYQTTNPTSGNAKVRLVATLADTDLTKYSKVGFEVVAVYEKNGAVTTASNTFKTEKVYTAIGVVTDSGYSAISADSLIDGDGENQGYIFAMVITNVPEGVTFQVRTFSISADGTTTTYGATEVFTIDSIPSASTGLGGN